METGVFLRNAETAILSRKKQERHTSKKRDKKTVVRN